MTFVQRTVAISIAVCLIASVVCALAQKKSMHNQTKNNQAADCTNTMHNSRYNFFSNPSSVKHHSIKISSTVFAVKLDLNNRLESHQGTASIEVKSTDNAENNLCQANGDCSAATSPKTNELSSPVPIKDLKIPESFFEDKIILDSTAQEYYAGSITKINRVKNQFKATLQKIAQINYRLHCKLTVLLTGSEGFRFILTHPHRLKRETQLAQFYSNENAIYYFVEELNNPGITSLIIHEMHHAFVSYQNRINKQLFFSSKTEKFEYTAIPCNTTNKGNANCEQIIKILKGLFENDLVLLHKRLEQSTSKARNPYYKRYLELAKDYKPLNFETEISKDFIDKLKSRKLIDENLTILTAEGYIKKEINEETLKKISPYYIYSIARRDDRYFVLIRTCTDSEKNVAPILDMLFFINQYGSEALSEKIIEGDAIVHQIFEPYYPLLDFLFPGLTDFHFQRASSEYQNCINALSKNASMSSPSIS